MIRRDLAAQQNWKGLPPCIRKRLQISSVSTAPMPLLGHRHLRVPLKWLRATARGVGEWREGVAGLSPLLRMHWESQCECSTVRGGTGPPGDAPRMCGALLVVGQEPAGAGRYRGHRCSEGTPSRVRKKWGGRLSSGGWKRPPTQAQSFLKSCSLS